VRLFEQLLRSSFVVLTAASAGFTLGLGLYVSLQHITMCGKPKDVLTRILGPPLTLREHRISSIRLIAALASSSLFDVVEKGPSVMEAWERLDQILYDPGVRAQGRDEPSGLNLHHQGSHVSYRCKGTPCGTITSIGLEFVRGLRSSSSTFHLFCGWCQRVRGDL
jgi:hypothetical protein